MNKCIRIYLYLIVLIFLVSWKGNVSSDEFAKEYTRALLKRDTLVLKQFIKPAIYVPFYAIRFNEVSFLQSKKINDTLSSFSFKTDRGVIHAPIVKNNGEMWVDFNLKYPKDEFSYTIGIYLSNDSVLNNVILSYDFTRWGISASNKKDIDSERDAYNLSIGSVEKLHNLMIDNKNSGELNLRITKSRWNGKGFEGRQVKEFDIAVGEVFKLASIF